MNKSESRIVLARHFVVWSILVFLGSAAGADLPPAKAPADFLKNADFETGKDGLPEAWRFEGDKARVRGVWESTGGIKGSHCLSIAAVDPAGSARGKWKQTVELAPYTPYLLKGFIKGRDLHGQGKLSAAMGLSTHKENGPSAEKGSFDWTPFEFDFATGPSGRVDIHLSLGSDGKESSGTVWFDNLTLERNSEMETFESRHFVLHLYKDQIALATRDGIQRQLANVDKLCEAYTELTGFAPNDGKKQSAFSPSRYPIGALGWSGNPVLWDKKAYLKTLPNWSKPEFCAEVFLHELAHDFDHWKWTFHGHFNELKMFYALETCNFAIAEDGWTQGPATRHRWEFRTEKQREQGICDEQVQVYRNILVRDKVGWEPFKKTFRYFLALPDNEVPKTPWEKFKRWHDKLSEFAGFDAWSVYSKAELEFVKFFYESHPEPAQLSQIALERKSVPLAEVKWESAKVGWNEPKAGFFASGEKLHVQSLYAHAPSRYGYTLDGQWKNLTGSCGLAKGNNGSVVFVVKGDGKELFRSDLVKDAKERSLSVALAGVKKLELLVEDGGDGGNGDWGIWFDPKLER